MPDVLASTATTSTLTVGGSATDVLEVSGDHDWFAVGLTAGVQVTVTIYGITLEDSFLNLRDSSGLVVASDDDIKDGQNRNSELTFVPTATGIYYIDVGAFNDAYHGTYQVSVEPGTQLPIATVDTIAGYLVQGAWGGNYHPFAASQGGTITVNTSMLNSAEQNLANTALQEWSDVTGVHFSEVTTGAQITFDNQEETPGIPTAVTDVSWSSGTAVSAHVQISTSWVSTYGTSLNTYSFQTYLHEIGHALGLGHGGDYDGSANYSTDALFRNDGWPTTIMSYFDQSQNSYFADQGFSQVYAITPMEADIAAMQTLYGLSTTTRTGDTIYGFNSNAGGVYNASLYSNVAVTIYDSGGIDTIDYSLSTANQLINLNPETYSNVNSRTGNLAIGRGVLIENALGGSGDDTLVGNGASNVLNGNSGNDSLDGRAGNDLLIGGAGSDVVAGGDGFDAAVYDGLYRTYSVTMAAGSGTISGGREGGTDTLSGIESVQLRDGVLSFDADGLAAQVARMYETVLQRAPDAAGLDFWLDELEDHGASLKTVASSFLNSPEFQAKTGALSNAGYVDFLYESALGRLPDADGKAYWVSQLDAGYDRADLLIGFSESDEHRGLTANIIAQGFFTTDDTYQAVALLYDSFTGRKPEEGGLTYWSELVKDGALSLDQVANGFASSEEFQGKTAGMSNGELVDFMYQNTLHRLPDNEGHAYWVSQLDSGKITLGGLLLYFSQSAEHYQLIIADITNGIALIQTSVAQSSEASASMAANREAMPVPDAITLDATNFSPAHLSLMSDHVLAHLGSQSLEGHDLIW